MKFKRIIVAVLLLCITLSLSSCSKEVTIDGVEYAKWGEQYCVGSVDTKDMENEPKSIYILDEINGISVEEMGWGYSPTFTVLTNDVERIYFPWSLKRNNGLRVIKTSSKYFIFCSALTLNYNSDTRRYVIPKSVYIEALQQMVINDCYIPANISYFFNYDDSPNENYFFIDIVEESSKLTKPPYDPKREGHTFAGWYKDEACTEIFDFDNDIVEIKFDEEGNRIYEEICLYAGWEKEPTTWEKITDWFKSLFN